MLDVKNVYTKNQIESEKNLLLNKLKRLNISENFDMIDYRSILKKHNKDEHQKDPQYMFESINKILKFTPSYLNWLSILHHLFLTTNARKSESSQIWSAIDLAIQQILSCKSSVNADKLETSKQEFLILQNKYNYQKNINADLLINLEQLESKCEVLQKQKSHIDKMHIHTISSLNKQIKDYQEKVKHLETPTKTDNQNNVIEDIRLSPPTTPEQTKLVVPPPPPPPLFSLCSPQAPPLPFKFKNDQPTKKIPISKVPMKFFNWSKISNDLYKETLWSKFDEEKLYKILDLDEFENTFSAYQNRIKNPASSDNETSFSLSPNNNGKESSDSSDDQIEKTTNKPKKEFSVIDSRRATNLEILLAKFRKHNLTNNKLQNIILNMDAKDELPNHMIEQLLKFVPTQEEEALLNENSSESLNMAGPDRFLYTMSKIFHYKSKLEALYFKKKYTDLISDLRKKITKTIDCCTTLLENKNVPTLLNIILCMGNFMNQGHRNGTVLGFSISNLNKLIDIKSSTDKSYSLLHYLIHTIEKFFPEILIITHELESVYEVSKINLGVLQLEWKSIEQGFNLLQNEINEHKLNFKHLKDSDQFIDIISKFHREHSQDIFDLKTKFFDMNSQYFKTLKYFGEDEKRIKFEEFFNTWSIFLQSFSEIRLDLQSRKMQLEEKTRKQKEAEELKSVRLRSRSSSIKCSDNSQIIERNKIKKTISQTDNTHIEDLDSLVNAIGHENVMLFSSNYTRRPKELANRRRRIDFDYPYQTSYNRERTHSTNS